jgi:hypothetical protein
VSAWGRNAFHVVLEFSCCDLVVGVDLVGEHLFHGVESWYHDGICQTRFEKDLKSWDVSTVTNICMHNMFCRAGGEIHWILGCV